MPGAGHGFAHVFATGVVPPDDPPPVEPFEPPEPLEPPVPGGFDGSPLGGVAVGGAPSLEGGAVLGSAGSVVVVAVVGPAHAIAIDAATARPVHANAEKPLAIRAFVARIPPVRNRAEPLVVTDWQLDGSRW